MTRHDRGGWKALRDDAQLQNLVLMQVVMAKASLEKRVSTAQTIRSMRFLAWIFR